MKKVINLKCILNSIFMSFLFFCINVFAQDVRLLYDTSFNEQHIYIKDCLLIAEYNSPKDGFYSKSAGGINDLTCVADQSLLTCRSSTGSDVVAYTKLEKGQKSAKVGQLIQTGFPDLKGPIDAIKKLNSMKKKCVGKHATLNVIEDFPEGKPVSVMVWGDKGQDGYSGVVTSVLTANRMYKVQVTSIFTNSSQLNGSECSGYIPLQKHKDEGRILTIPSFCFSR